MRLNDFQIKKIKEAVVSSFGGNSSVYLFGSRTDDNKKGGDIDLLVVTPIKGTDLEWRKVEALASIQLDIGDQKIDMLTTDPYLTDPPLIIKEALKGIVL